MCCDNISFNHSYSTQNRVHGRHFQAIWRPNPTQGAEHGLPKCAQIHEKWSQRVVTLKGDLWTPKSQEKCTLRA